MSIVLDKIIKVGLIFLFFSLPLINSKFLNILGIDYGLYVDGNFEFTKVMFFNIISAIIIACASIIYILKPKSLKINRGFFYTTSLIILLFLVSTTLSISPFISLFGSESKGHGLIMFLNLIGIFIILANFKKSFLNTLIKTTVISSIIVSLIAIKEYYLPSFDYGDLSNRALGTLGHPNYLALFLITTLPLIYSSKFLRKNKHIYLIAIVLTIFTILLTKSAWGIFILFFYTIYLFIKKLKITIGNKEIFTISFCFLILGALGFFLFPEKLSSFISRFFIWSTTLEIVFSDIKNIVFGAGFDTLSLIFSNHKSTYLYIFENIGYTADRPHNLFLNILYHTGIIGAGFLVYLIFFAFKNYERNPYFEGIIIFFIFTLFNFSSISIYLILILLFAKVKKDLKIKKALNQTSIPIMIVIITSISVIGGFFSYKYYIAESYSYTKDYIKAKNIFPYNPNYYYNLGESEKGLEVGTFHEESYFLSKIYLYNNIKNDCDGLLLHFPSVENYFYCGSLLEELGEKNNALQYYKKGVDKLPDLWNKDSKYYNNSIIKETINGNRLLSEKYSNTKDILKKLEIEITKK